MLQPLQGQESCYAVLWQTRKGPRGPRSREEHSVQSAVSTKTIPQKECSCLDVYQNLHTSDNCIDTTEGKMPVRDAVALTFRGNSSLSKRSVLASSLTTPAAWLLSVDEPVRSSAAPDATGIAAIDHAPAVSTNARTALSGKEAIQRGGSLKKAAIYVRTPQDALR